VLAINVIANCHAKKLKCQRLKSQDQHIPVVAEWQQLLIFIYNTQHMTYFINVRQAASWYNERLCNTLATPSDWQKVLGHCSAQRRYSIYWTF